MGHRLGRAFFSRRLDVADSPFGGVFGEQNEAGLDSLDDVAVTPSTLIGGVFQGVTITADADLSAFVPYLILNQENGFVQNSTVVEPTGGGVRSF